MRRALKPLIVGILGRLAAATMVVLRIGLPLLQRRWRPLLVLLAGVAIPLWVVGEVAGEVFADEGYAWDGAALELAREVRSPQLDRFMRTLTNTVSWWGVGAGTILLTLLEIWRRAVRAALFVPLAVGGAWLLSGAAKLAFRRARPDYWESIQPETSYSFPSGHAMCSMAFGLAVAFVAWHGPLRWPAVLFAIVFAGSIGISRIYLGVHYPTDVIAGWLASIAWTTGVLLVLRPRRQAVTCGSTHQHRR